MDLYEKITSKHSDLRTVADVKAFFETLCEDIAWHPDDPFADYINTDTGQPTFTPEQAEKLDNIMQMAFLVCSVNAADPYGLACDVYHALNNDQI